MTLCVYGFAGLQCSECRDVAQSSALFLKLFPISEAARHEKEMVDQGVRRGKGCITDCWLALIVGWLRGAYVDCWLTASSLIC